MKKIITNKEALELLDRPGREYAVVKNPEYIHPDFEIYPLALKSRGNLPELSAVLMDMDGTTTTTEELCIHSLEFMIRKMSGRLDKTHWAGLDHNSDYPHIIGNSTTKHVEFLINKYSSSFQRDEIIKSFLYAAVWTLAAGQDKQRKEEVRANLNILNVGHILADEKYLNLTASELSDPSVKEEISEYFFNKYQKCFKETGYSELVRIGIDVYYQRYHEILERIKKGESRQISIELFNDSEKHLIEPMPGVEVFLPLIKGWLGNNIRELYDYLTDAYMTKCGKTFDTCSREEIIENLAGLSSRFAANPLKIAIVTSSIFYEADIVIGEVFKVIRSRIEKMNLAESIKSVLKSKFENYREYYDSVVTASDSNEIRLKPHRDLYSIALNQLGIPREKFSAVAGFEDSESGTIAIRAAGIGLCIAVPFAQTTGHNFEAASFICRGGLPEVLLMNNLFLKSDND